MHNFEEVPDPDSEGPSSDIFYKPRPKQASANSASREWQNKLNLEPNPPMINRKVEITDIQLVNDGYLSSHKEYKIRSYSSEGTDEKEISRRYSDFEWLVNQLVGKYPGCIIPPLPEKNPLTNINQENVGFLENRKRGLLNFLEKMLQHPDLRYAPDFITFLLSNDIEFNNIVEKSKKAGALIPTITNLIEQIPNVTSVSFFSGIFNRAEKVKREKTEQDHKIDNHESYLGFLETSIAELTKYASEMGNVEREQSNISLDLSNNLNEISKFDKNSKLMICKKMSTNTELCSTVQKEHAKYFTEELETRLKEIGNYVSSAQQAIKRRNTLKEIIEKNETQISELERQKNSKYLEMLRVNQDNKTHLEEIDNILLDELQNFEPEIVQEIDRVARDFMKHQTNYAKEMYEKWVSDES